MGDQPTRLPESGIHEYKKPLREKGKNRKHIRKRGGLRLEENHIATEREISEATLKRLHTLGIQKFGSSPFSEHFDRWLQNVTAVLDEFKSNPNLGVDDQFEKECSQALSSIKHQLEAISRKETTLNRELSNLSDWKSRLKQINKEYSTLAGSIKSQRNREIKHICSVINRLKKDQDEVIRMKTGFFRGVSKKKREQKELAKMQELTDKQTELELVMLDFHTRQKELRVEYDRKREPLLEEIKKYRRIIQNLETDGSLEERWFACEALIDSINSFLQRKSTQSTRGTN
jgi:hypothetical protein